VAGREIKGGARRICANKSRGGSPRDKGEGGKKEDRNNTLSMSVGKNKGWTKRKGGARNETDENALRGKAPRTA